MEHEGYVDIPTEELPTERVTNLSKAKISGVDSNSQFKNVAVSSKLADAGSQLSEIKIGIRISIHDIKQFNQSNPAMEITPIIQQYFNELTTHPFFRISISQAYVPISSAAISSLSEKIRNEILGFIKDRVDLTKIGVNPYKNNLDVETVDEIDPDIIMKPNLRNSELILDNIGERLRNLINSLSERVYAKDRDLLILNDEWDLLYFLQPILLTWFEIVIQEEYTPKYASRSSKVDFILKNEDIAIEVKFVHDHYNEAQISQQLDDDYRVYTGNDTIRLVYCYVFDPNHKIKNPVSFIRDLERHRSILKPLRVSVIS